MQPKRRPDMLRALCEFVVARPGARCRRHRQREHPGRLSFPNRHGIDTNVFLGSAELAAICALLGRIPSVEEYLEQVKVVNAKAADIYRYMNFDQISEFAEMAETVTV